MGGNPRVFDLSHVALHTTRNDCWLVINGQVIDVTKFLEEHPGGEEVLLEASGKDATKEFEAIGHSKAAYGLLLEYQVGVMRGFKHANAATAEDDTEEGTKARACVMTGSAIKDDKKTRCLGAIEFVLPLVVASFAFWYHYSSAGLTGMTQ
ncbi:cytochrome [Musa troglodytarum]|uniref:Cytochrome n=1 Tax=Musa troglodytarum TaxID=320322 RepID=A0A9E7IBL9_9LILI|nr:cytochrome [Musa troglodytarum]